MRNLHGLVILPLLTVWRDLASVVFSLLAPDLLHLAPVLGGDRGPGQRRGRPQAALRCTRHVLQPLRSQLLLVVLCIVLSLSCNIELNIQLTKVYMANCPTFIALGDPPLLLLGQLAHVPTVGLVVAWLSH